MKRPDYFVCIDSQNKSELAADIGFSASKLDFDNYWELVIEPIMNSMGEALAVVCPATTLQTCIVHLIRNSLDYASWKDRKALATAIKPIYTASSCDPAKPRPRPNCDGFHRRFVMPGS